MNPLIKAYLDKKQVLLLNPLGRNFEVYPSDTFLVSYPKSGNTWVRFLLANLIASTPPKSFPEANSVIPDVHNKKSLAILKGVAESNRILKSHFAFEPAYNKVIYIVRDPRSVAVSQYFFKIRRGEISKDMAFSNYFQKFLKGFEDHYGSWGEHAASWIAAREHNPDFYLVRYEDLKQDTKGELSKMVDFLGLKVGDDLIDKAIENSSLTSMQKIEKESKLGHDSLSKKGDLSIPFVRKGSSTEWTEYLDEHMVEEMQDRFHWAMEKCGYLNV